jgi:FAD/FMN-containing dehydrogenase
VREAADAVTALIRRRVVPATIELMDRQSLDAVAAYVGERLAPEGTDALLLVEIDGVAEAIEAEANQVAAACRESGALECSARDAAEREALWRVRRETSYALRTIAPLKLNNDVVVPRGRVPELFALVERLRTDISSASRRSAMRAMATSTSTCGGSRGWRRHGSGTSRREGIVRRCDRARRLNQRRARHRRREEALYRPRALG